uniref:Uncharacterized protein n=1 Tax=Panagrolaimus sp. JU765 TaxID=591449 RepID=A0AC34QAM5_9BILA
MVDLMFLDDDCGFFQRPYSLFSTLVDTIKAAKSNDSLDKDEHGNTANTTTYDDKNAAGRRLSNVFNLVTHGRRASRADHQPVSQTQQLLRRQSRSRTPSPNDYERDQQDLTRTTVRAADGRGPYRSLGTQPGDQYQMAHFHPHQPQPQPPQQLPPLPSSSRSTTYRTPPNTMVTDSARRMRDYEVYDDPSEPMSSNYSSGIRSSRYPGTPRRTPRSYRREQDHGFSDEDEEISDTERITLRPYAPPNSANVRRLPLIGQTMSLGYGGTRALSDPNEPHLSMLPQRRPPRPVTENYPTTSAPYMRYGGHVPPSPSPRSPAELHMYSDPSYPNQLPLASTMGIPSGSYNTHSLPPVAPYPTPRQSIYPSSPQRIMHNQSGIPLTDSDTETDGGDVEERWARV